MLTVENRDMPATSKRASLSLHPTSQRPMTTSGSETTSLPTATVSVITLTLILSLSSSFLECSLSDVLCCLTLSN